MSFERNIVVDRILHAIDHGKLPPAQTESRLHALIDQEIDRTDMPADAALIDGCLELLEQLHTPAEAPDAPKRSALGFVRVCKWVAVAAAVIFLVLGLTDNLRWHWFEHSTSEDGEQHIIIGHEVEVDVIQEAIAEHQGGKQNFRFTSVAEMERYLGFNPGIPSRLADAYEADDVRVSFLSEQIMFLASYHSTADPDHTISLNVNCYVSLSEMSISSEESEVGEIYLISGCSVYVSRSIDHEVAQWMNGTACFILSVPGSAVSVAECAREIIDGSIAPDSNTGITAEQIAASIQRNMSHTAAQLETDDFGELCDYLGFVPDVIRPEVIGVDSVLFIGTTTPIYLLVDVIYRDADGNTLTIFTCTYYSSLEEVQYSFEESEEGEFIRIGNHSVYSTMNYSWRVYSWTEGLNVCCFSTKMEHDDAVAMLEDYFAGNVIVREEKSPLTGVTAEQIAASIQRHMTYDTQPLQTEDFGALCEYLGFVPDLIQPEAIGADSVYFSASTTPAFLRVVIHYRDADKNTMIHFSGAYYSSMEDAIFAFEESEEGEFIQIGDRSVYTTMNFSWRVYNWTEDLSICYISTQMGHDDAVAILEDYFAGNVIVREKKSPLTGVTSEEIMASTQQSTDQELQYLRTSDYAKVCEFLGFTPELIRPEMLEATGIDFSAEILPDRVQLDVYYLNVDGLAKNQFSIYYYPDPDKIPYYVEENETGHFIDVCGQQVYTTPLGTQSAYSWRFENGVCAFFCDAKRDLSLPALEDYLSGNFMTMAAAATLPTSATEQQIADAIMRQDQQQLMTSDFSELCDFLGFTPPIFRPEVFNAKETLYSASVWSDWLSLAVLYQPEDPEYNVVMQIQYFQSMDEVYSNFEQSETGVFLNIADTTVYCAPNLHRTSYAWVDNTITYLLSGVLPKETTLPLLEAYFRGDQYTPDTPGIWPWQA